MSRAREHTSVYVVADSLDQATDDLRRKWGTDRRLGWVIDTGTPMTEPAEIEASRFVNRPMRDALRHGRLVTERDAILAVIPTIPRSRFERPSSGAATSQPSARTSPLAQAATATILWPGRFESSALPRATSPA